MFYPQFVYLTQCIYIKLKKVKFSLVVIILHKLWKLFVYIHFQFGNSAFSFARLNYLPEVAKLLVKHGAEEVSLYLYDNNIRNIYIFTNINKFATYTKSP